MLHIRVLEATGITPGPSCPYCHPYIRVSDPHFSIRTRAVDNHVNPHWNQDLHFHLLGEDFTEIHFELHNFDPFGSDTKMATYTLSAARLPLGALIDEWFTFLPAPDLRIHMKIHRPALYEPPFHEEPDEIAAENDVIEFGGGPREIFDGTDDDGDTDGGIHLFRELIAQGGPPPMWLQGFGGGRMAEALRQIGIDVVPGGADQADDADEEEEDRMSDEEEEDDSDVVEVSRDQALGRELG
jgi:hypothetical protein